MVTQHRSRVRRKLRTGRPGKAYQRIRSNVKVRARLVKFYGAVDVDVDVRMWVLPHTIHFMCCAEQQCHLLKDRVDDHHLDQNPGYKIKDSCDSTSKLTTLQECNAARLALDWKVTNVVETNDTSFPTGCYRRQNEKYRVAHVESSYLWYFNKASGVQSHSNSEPVCKG